MFYTVSSFKMQPDIRFITQTPMKTRFSEAEGERGTVVKYQSQAPKNLCPLGDIQSEGQRSTSDVVSLWSKWIIRTTSSRQCRVKSKKSHQLLVLRDIISLTLMRSLPTSFLELSLALTIAIPFNGKIVLI